MDDLDTVELHKVLNSIMEYELAGVVRYTHYALMVRGPNRIPIVDFFKAQATESLEHAQQAGEILTGLEGHPTVHIAPIKETHNHSIGALLRESLEHELAAVALYKDLLIIPNEHEGQSRLLALSTADGSIRWQVERESRVSYATPCIHKNGSRDELIFVNWHYGITAVDPASGARLWQADVFDKSHIESSIASPIIAGGLVLGVSGWLGHGNEVIAVQPPPVGSDEAPRQVYRISRGAPLCTTPLVQDDLLFLWSDNGVVTAADSQTGTIHWQKRIGGTFYSSPICLDGAIYNIDVNGKVTVLKAAAEYQQLGSCSLGDPCHSTPAIGHGRLYLRTFTTLSALDPQP